MIETYFAEIEATIHTFPYTDSYLLKKKRYNKTFGYIGGTITFENNYCLNFMEAKQLDPTIKAKYRYQYMDEDDKMIFRYDNSSHHKHLPNFPHHKHLASDKIIVSTEPELHDILLEIAQTIRKNG